MKHVVALSGGVGGAKLALGLSHVLAPEQLSIIANTADDFELLGLPISPDLDTLMYSLAGISNAAQGWGIEGESWAFMQALKCVGGPGWFQLGDKDLATHTMRRHYLSEGKSLSEATVLLSRALGVSYPILPMSDDPVATFVSTASGPLSFQDYFVAQQCKPVISDFYFQGIDAATPSAQALAAIARADAIIICPSNPFVSIAPILSVPGMKAALQASSVPIVIVSPIIAGAAIKGPTAKMMQELNMPVTALAVAEHYADVASHFVLDCSDENLSAAVADCGYKTLVCNTLMKTLDDKKQLAADILAFVKP
jgi:LPPG:FO 2-phospho-L-lactate transferase